jgi:cytochrome d ubiquinol oxidase subunit II
LIGVLAVASAAYLAAVFLCADARRLRKPELEQQFRTRALGAGVLTGAIALIGLPVLRYDAHPLFHELVAGAGLPALVVSILAGSCTLVLVWRQHYEAARYGAAVAVAATIAGWALAQSPVMLQGLTIEAAAAPRSTLIAVIVSVFAGGVILFPSLALLFKLVLSGRLAYGVEDEGRSCPQTSLAKASLSGLPARTAAACLVAGVGLLTVADTGWAHGVGIALLLTFVGLGFPSALPPDVFSDAPRADALRRHKNP